MLLNNHQNISQQPRSPTNGIRNWQTTSLLDATNIIQFNAGRCKAAMLLLQQTIATTKVDYILLQEPPLGLENRITHLPTKWQVWTTTNNKAAIISTKQTTTTFISSKPNSVAIKIPQNNRTITLISAYSSPYDNLAITLQEIEDTLRSLRKEQVIIGADLNAHSAAWGYGNEDRRGADVIQFQLSNNLILLNPRHPPPTFQRGTSKGWPDLTFVSDSSLANMSEWKVLDEETQSDHSYINISINSPRTQSKLIRFKTQYGGHSKLQHHLKNKIPQLLHSINQVTNHSEADAITLKIQETIFQACKLAYKPKKAGNSSNPPWWTQTIANNRTKLKTQRKKLNRSTDPIEKETLKKTYSLQRAKYKKEILEAKRTAWRNFCTKTSNAYGASFKTTMGKHSPPSNLFHLTPLAPIGDEEYVASHILEALYPDEQLQNFQPPTINTNNPEPPFTYQELNEIVKKLPTDKAPGIDSIDYKTIQNIHHYFPELLLTYLNKCLNLTCFPTPLKSGIVLLFHKPGKDLSTISSYRPIVLLPTIGKLYEKLLLQRFRFYQLKHEHPSPLQFGFRQGVSIDDALLHLDKKVQEIHIKKEKAAIISLDIKGAFDNILYSSIAENLTNLNYKTPLHATLLQILTNRTVNIETSNNIVSKPQLKGCPQGSCSGPYFWNLLTESILKQKTNDQTSIQAFADDFLIIIHHTTRAGLLLLSQEILHQFHLWTSHNNLNISIEKSNYLLLGSLKKGPSIKWLGRNIRRKSTIKYLGVQLDEKWRWTPHISYLKAKAIAKFNLLSQIAGPNWGLQWDFRKLLYNTVVLRMLLHGAALWGHRLTERQKRKLASLQRPFLLNITRAYRTTPTLALQVATGIPPLHISVLMEAVKNRTIRSIPSHTELPARFQTLETKVSNLSIHPAEFNLSSSINPNKPYVETPQQLTYFTDGSKSAQGVGCAFCTIQNMEIKDAWKGKLEYYNSVFQAEICAIHQALSHHRLHHNHQQDFTTIWTDSLSSIQAIQDPTTPHLTARRIQAILHSSPSITLSWIKAHAGHTGNEIADSLAKDAPIEGNLVEIPPPISNLKGYLKYLLLHLWQEEWDEGETGRKYHSIFPRTSLKPTIKSREMLQFFTEHGPFPAYLARFSLADSDLCSCGEVGTALHYATSCPLTESFHLSEPSIDNYTTWLKNIANNTGSKTRIIQIIRFINENEHLFRI